MTIQKRLTLAGLSVLLAAGGACTAEVERQGEAPDVDVDVDAGQLPKVDVDPARIEVNADTQKVITPDIDVVPADGEKK